MDPNSAQRETESSEKKIETLQSELAAEKDRYLRLATDFNNFRKRTTREMERRAAANGFTLEARAAGRIAAAAEAAAAGETDADTVTDAARYPRLIWVSDEVPGLEFPVRNASLVQSR